MSRRSNCAKVARTCAIASPAGVVVSTAQSRATRAPAQLLIEAVVVGRGTQGAGRRLLGSEEPGYLEQFEVLITQGSRPWGFDPSNDVNVAQWARELHRLAGRRAHAYSDAAH